jgi:multisite-specific tRNA:(cytosine-C5)-methyltransferase
VVRLLAGHLRFGNIMEDSMRIYPHLQDTGGFFVAVLQHRRPTASPKYGLAPPIRRLCSILDTREGKRTAEEVGEVHDVKKARLESDEDVLMAPAAEVPTSKGISRLTKSCGRH